jgi:hypothetical protein
MSGIGNFSILMRSANPAPLREYEPNTSEYTFIASAISIALAILEDDIGRQHLTELALAFDTSRDGSNHFGNDRTVARSWVDFFLTTVRSRFPVVIKDHQISNANILGTHPRGNWEGTLAQFNPRNQMILINGGVRISLLGFKCGLIELLAC